MNEGKNMRFILEVVTMNDFSRGQELHMAFKSYQEAEMMARLIRETSIEEIMSMEIWMERFNILAALQAGEPEAEAENDNAS